MSQQPNNWVFTAELDGGDKACGDLILELRAFFQALAPGTRACIRAADPGAIIDIAAWCRQTGHKLVEAEPPYYLVERRA